LDRINDNLPNLKKRNQADIEENEETSSANQEFESIKTERPLL